MMKILKSSVPLLGLIFLAWLAFVDNIPIGYGDAYSYISPEEFFESNPHPLHQKSEEDGLVDFSDYLDFASRLNGSHYDRTFEAYLDTTGDGKKELVRSKVVVDDGVCLVVNSIIRNSNLIWEEEISLSKRDLLIYFGPGRMEGLDHRKALAYLGTTFSRFTESSKAFASSGVYDVLSRQASICGRSIDLERIESYKGHFIFKRNPAESGLYMWNAETNQFDQLIEFNSEV